jgi:HD-GYP domain-containing protein (c-di-GMP phosphodiesterase class II)
MYRQIIDEAIAKIEANRQRDIEVAKQKAMQDQITPFNRDMDESLRKAIAELQTQHNAKIAQMQQAFEAEKQALAEVANNKKAAFAETTISTAVFTINAVADDMIEKMREFIGEGA